MSTNDENGRVNTLIYSNMIIIYFVGSWVSWVVKTKVLSNKEKSMIIEQFSELAAG